MCTGDLNVSKAIMKRLDIQETDTKEILITILKLYTFLLFVIVLYVFRAVDVEVSWANKS